MEPKTVRSSPTNTVASVSRFLERFAPTDLAEDWDNVGLLVGDPDRNVQRMMTCLTLTPDVAAEAISERADLVVTHHPVLFKPTQRLVASDPQSRMLMDLIAARVAVYSPHTAYDNDAAGINQQLAESLGLVEIEPLKPGQGVVRSVIVAFVPKEHLSAVQQAVWNVGGGQIGEYSECSFHTEGTGTFRGSLDSHPTVGQPGRLEQVHEARLEITCSERCLPAALKALYEAHPYEEPAVDVYKLESPLGGGAGRLGNLANELSFEEFLSLVREKLGYQELQAVPPASGRVRRVGIVCGSGGEFLRQAIRRGCDLFLTGEARFHAALEARAAGIGLLLAGHYQTERPALERLAERMAAELPGLETWASRVERDPLQAV